MARRPLSLDSAVKQIPGNNINALHLQKCKLASSPGMRLTACQLGALTNEIISLAINL